jgi:hypothetical protein
LPQVPSATGCLGRVLVGSGIGRRLALVFTCD